MNAIHSPVFLTAITIQSRISAILPRQEAVD
jgi:hypothetical protein